MARTTLTVAFTPRMGMAVDGDAVTFNDILTGEASFGKAVEDVKASGQAEWVDTAASVLKE